MKQVYLPGDHERGRWMRLDAARILKRYFFCERSLILSQGGWLAGIASFDVKTLLPLFFWQDTMIAHALRERVFELRFPSRMMEIGDDAPLIDLFDAAGTLPAQKPLSCRWRGCISRRCWLPIANTSSWPTNWPTARSCRALRTAIDEKTKQIAALTSMAQAMLLAAPERAPAAGAWVSALGLRLIQAGGAGVAPPQPAPFPADLPGRTPFQLAEIAARDPAYHLCRYYWPDVVDPGFPYGEGMQLQLRSAVSHVNEVWAVETGGAILQAFGDELGWEFIFDAARWTYDESRHTRMGYERLKTWGYQPHEIPLGSYIYDSARGQDPVIRLGMLHYFETKNIGKKTKRAEAFASYDDKLSQHDMDFDWADETIHAAYGHRWLDALRALHPERVPDIDTIRQQCDSLVAAQVAAATPADRSEIYAVAQAMLAKVEE